MLSHGNPAHQKLGKSLLKKRNFRQHQSSVSLHSLAPSSHHLCDKENEGIQHLRFNNVAKCADSQPIIKTDRTQKTRGKSVVINLMGECITEQQIEQLRENNKALKEKINEKQTTIKQIEKKLEVTEKKYNYLIKSQSKKISQRVGEVSSLEIKSEKSVVETASKKTEGIKQLSKIREKLTKISCGDKAKKQ